MNRSHRRYPPRLGPRGLPVLFLILFSLPASLRLAADEADDARRVWLTGYVKLEEAGKAESDRNYTLAIDLYRGAREVFAKVRTRYPAWNPALLDYRINYCAARVRRLEAALAANRNTLNRDQLLQLTRKLQERLKTLTVRDLELKKKLELTSEALDRARAEAARGAAASEAASKVVAERDNLRQLLQAAEKKADDLAARLQQAARNAGLRKKIRELQQERDLAVAARKQLSDALAEQQKKQAKTETRLNTLSARYTQLLTESRARRKELADAKALAAENRTLTAQLTGALAEIERLKTDANTARARLEATEAERAALQKKLDEIGRLRAQLAATEKARAELKERVAELEAGARDANGKFADIRRENARLAEMTNDLQARIDEYKKKQLKTKEEVAAVRAGLETRLAAAVARSEVLEAERRQLSAQLADARTSLVQLRDAVTKKSKSAPVAQTPSQEPPLTQSDIETRLTTMSRELKTARRDLGLARKNLAESAARRAELEREIRKQADQLKTRQQTISDLQRDLTEQKQKTLDLATATDAARNQNRKLTDRVTALQTENRKIADELARERTQRAADNARLQSATKRIEELTPLVTAVTDHKRRLEEQNAQIAALRKQLADREAQVKALEARLADSDRRSAVQTATVEQLRAEAAGLRAKLAGAERLGRRHTERLLKKQLDDVSKQLDESRKKNHDLNERCRTQLALLQKNEKSARALEKARENAEKELALKTAELATVRDRLKRLEEDAHVVDGLKSSLDDADADLTQTRRKLDAALANLEHLRQLQTDTARQLEDSKKTVHQLEQALVDERDRRITGNDALMEQVRQLTDQLDTERARVSALQLALQQRDRKERAAFTPEHHGPSTDAERNTRRRDERFLVRGYLRQALEAEQKNRNEAAVWNYRKVLEYDPGNRQALKRLGLLAAQHGDDAETIRCLTRAFYADPDDGDTLLALGYALVREQKADMAVSMLARAAALYPDNAAIQRSLGVAYSSLGWSDAAEAQFRRALRLNKKDGEAAFNLAVLLATRRPNELTEARKWYTTAKELGAQADPGLDALFAARPTNP
ncbi:MAG: hypothetical protein GXP31_15265 [Kiritimatiellaeota bacterium]|nr:hypothetical protein [Kiritimatiellota bacterium]